MSQKVNRALIVPGRIGDEFGVLMVDITPGAIGPCCVTPAKPFGQRGDETPARTMILSGGITEAIAVVAGDAACVRIEGLDGTSIRLV